MISNCIYTDYSGLQNYIWSIIANIVIKIFCQFECHQIKCSWKWDKSYGNDWVATIYIFHYLYYVPISKHIIFLQDKSVCAWMIYITKTTKLGNDSICLGQKQSYKYFSKKYSMFTFVKKQLVNSQYFFNVAYVSLTNRYEIVTQRIKMSKTSK